MNLSKVNHLKLRIGFLSILLICICCSLFVQSAIAIHVTADAAIAIDAATGKILYEKNIHQRRAPASTTKIMTTILGIELGQLSDKVTASSRAASEGGSSIWLETGEVLTLEEFLYGIMLSSGNDASVAVAEHLAGSVEEFAKMMNRKAIEVGALNTTFQNPNGLPNDKHLTTAFDLAMIMRYAMQNEIFQKITKTQYTTISWPGHEWDRGLRNHNKLLWMYPDTDGGKTGYTRAAGRCLVSSASRNGRRVIVVVLHADQLWQDSIKLLDYGLDNFSNIKLVKAGTEVHTIDIPESKEKIMKLIAGSDFEVTIPKVGESRAKSIINLYDDLQLPIRKGQKVGIMEFQINETIVGQVSLIAKNDVSKVSIVDRFWRWITSILKTFT